MYRACRLALLAGCVLAAAQAQQSVNYASIGGVVTDASGAVVTGADVTVRQTDTNISSTQTTNASGRFLFPYLRTGAWQVTVHKSGFQDATRAISLSVGAAFNLPFQLSPVAISTSIDVTDQAPVLENARTQIAGTLSQQEVKDLPLNGRSYFDVALFVPGVSPTNTAANQLFAESSAVPGQGISIGSQRNFSNSFIIDGVSANDDAAGVAGSFIGLDTVDEVQVVTSGGQAELGRALGGYVNVVTKSGGNVLHGDLYGYFRNSRFNAANPLAQTVLPLTQIQYGGSISGPLINNRTFYFFNTEARDLNQSGYSTVTPANALTINARLVSVGYGGPPVTTGQFSNPVHSENVFGKIDHHVSDADQFSVHYSLYHVKSLNSRGAGGLSTPSASANLWDTDHSVAASNVLTLSRHMVNETRLQFTNSSLSAPPSDLTGPAVTISGVATFGTLSISPTARINRLYELTDSLSIQRGAHSMRFGVDVLGNDDAITYPRSYRGNYTFSSLANFLAGVYNNSGFTQTFKTSRISQTNPNAGFYAQDEWQAAPRLTLNFGVRYDLEFLDTIETRKTNVSPRAGFAWTPLVSGRLVIRGGYGLFYDRIPLRPLANALLSAGNTVNPANLQQLSISLSPGQAGAPAFPDILASATIPPGVLFNLTTMDRHIRSAYSEQGSLEIEKQLGHNATISAGYQHIRGLHLLVSVNQNVPACAAAGTNNGCRPNAAFANDSQYSSAGDSHYDAGDVSFQQRPTKWGAYRVSYTYSKALDNVGEFFFSAPIDNFNIWRDYGRSDDDQRSRLAFEGSLDQKWLKRFGFQLSASLTAYSPLPFNITTGATTIQGTSARPIVNGDYIARNAGAGHALINASMRLSRTFSLTDKLKLQALGEVFNVLNHVNVVTLNGVFGSGAYPANPLPAFGQITAVNDPRTAQFAIRLSF